ncbi:Scn5a, partial [Symbiodinium necroappetens]
GHLDDNDLSPRSNNNMLDEADEASRWQRLRWSLQDIYEEQKACLDSFHALLDGSEYISPGSPAEGRELAAEFTQNRLPRMQEKNEKDEPGSPGTAGGRSLIGRTSRQPIHNARMQAFLRTSRQFSRTALVEATSLGLGGECPKCQEARTLGIPKNGACEHGESKEVSQNPTMGNTHAINVRDLISSRGTADSAMFARGSIWEKLFAEEEYSAFGEDHHHHQDHHSLWIRIRYWCYRVASKKIFDYIMGVIILANAVSVGLEVQYSLQSGEDTGWMYWLDFAFVMIYILEFLVRLLAWGLHKCFTDPWCLLDFSLVCVGVLSLIAQPLGLQVKELESLLVVRSLRLVRLIRALRLLKQFRTVWRLVNGLLTSANAMVSTLVLVVLTLYIAACLGIEIITKDTDSCLAKDLNQQNTETGDIVVKYFGTLPSTLLTLASFVTLDSVAPIYFPLILHKPLLGLYFFFIILFVSIALMNLVTAVLVEGALENASADKELEKLDLQVAAVLPHRRSSATCNSQHIVPTWHAHSQTREEETKSVACADVQEKLKSQMPRFRGSGMKRQPCSVVTLMLE